MRSSARDSSNIRPAINDGRWHSFGNSGSSAHASQRRNSAGAENSHLAAHSTGVSDARWHSFGPTTGLVGGGSRAVPGFGFRGDGWRGGRFGFGGDWGRGFGWGWGGWGFGFGWPYWGGYWSPYWAFGWDPWWYGPGWYAPLAYPYYPDYSYDWSDNPPPYAPDSWYEDDSAGNYLSAPNANFNTNYDANFNANYDDNHSDLDSDTIPLTSE